MECAGLECGAEDAVQEATLLGLRRLSQLRNPEAVGPWLRSITRNVTLMGLRSARPTEPLDAGTAKLAPGPTPEEVFDGHALRDWIWTAAYGNDSGV
jgi:RNA polymerase sigma-70 factor, ECF subfamily